MQGLCSLISILSLACAGMLCCRHYVGFWPCGCGGDIIFGDGCLVRKLMHFCPISPNELLGNHHSFCETRVPVYTVVSGPHQTRFRISEISLHSMQ